jgi:hypothetical protein
MFPHASKHSLGVRSSTRVLVLAAIIALVALAVPSGHALAKPQTGGGGVASGVGVVSYSNNLYAFVVGGDNHLWVDYWNRSSWQWSDQKTPPGDSVYEGIGAVSYGNDLDVFVQSGNNHLWMDFWDGSTWRWLDLGTPPGGVTLALTNAGVGVASYSNNLYVFVRGVDPHGVTHLWVDYWNGSSWQWADQGTPPGGVTVDAGVGVASYSNNLYVFVKGNDQHLWVDYWNRSSWQWADQGTSPSGIRLLSGVGVASYSNNLYVYLVGANNDLLVDMWNGSHWVWGDQGTPSATVSVGGGVGVASYSNNLYVFVQGYDPQGGLAHMWVDMWNGSSWQWADQGIP